MNTVQMSGNSSNSETIRKFSMLPLIFNASWYFSRNVGLIYAFYFDYNDFFIMGDNYDEYGNFESHGESDNLFLLNGLGFTYRTLSRVAAQFNIIQYAGPVKVHANSNIEGFLSAGEEDSRLFLPLAFDSILNINITPYFSIKTKMTMYLNIAALADDGGDSNGNEYSTIYFQFFSLGASVHF